MIIARRWNVYKFSWKFFENENATKLSGESFENFEAGFHMAEKEPKDQKINFQWNFPSISEASPISETKRTMRITFGHTHTHTQRSCGTDTSPFFPSFRTFHFVDIMTEAAGFSTWISHTILVTLCRCSRSRFNQQRKTLIFTCNYIPSWRMTRSWSPSHVSALEPRRKQNSEFLLNMETHYPPPNTAT